VSIKRAMPGGTTTQGKLVNTRKRKARVLFGVLGTALLLAACSSGSSTASTSSTTSTTVRSTPTTGAGATTTSVVVPPYSAAANARKDAQLVNCSDSPTAGWVASGTVTNSSSTARTYVIAVDIVTAKGDTVQATQVLHIPTVQPSKTANWATKPALAGKTGLTCVIREVLAG